MSCHSVAHAVLRPRTSCCVVAVAIALIAATADAASVSGILVTPDGRALPHAVVTLQGSAGSIPFVTGPEGQFRVSVPAGSYTPAIEAPGFVIDAPATLSISEADQAGIRMRAAAAPVQEQVLVTATRGEALASTLGVATTVIDRGQLEDRASTTVLRALEGVPGMAIARTGGVGPQASGFVRGGESSFVRVLVDGVPVNEPGGAFNFGTLLPFEVEQIEVLRGAASSLYGSDALAGVIQVVSRRPIAGQGPGLVVMGEAGTYATRRGAASTSGIHADWSWSLGGQRFETDNEQPNSHFAQTLGTLSLGRNIGEGTLVRVVGRADTGEAGTPGQTAFQRPDLDASHERSSFVGNAMLRHAHGNVAHELRLGHGRTHQLSLNPEDSGAFTPRSGDREGYESADYANPEGYQNDTRRLTAGYQAEVQVGRVHLMTAGVEMERETGEIGDRRGELLSPSRTNTGIYLQDRMVFADRLFVTIGGRLEHNGSYGTQVVPRAAIAWRLRGGSDATTLRASAGAGIKEPSFLQSYGVSTYALGNPDLEPETSRTVDIGLDQRLLDGRFRGEATVFRHEYRDQIAYFVENYDPFTGTYHNLGRTRAQGVEVALEAVPAPHLTISGTYTYLDGEIVESASESDPLYAVGQPLLRRPKHQGSVSAHLRTGRLAVGATLALVGKRADSDFAGLGFAENEGFRRLDARASYDVGRNVELFAAAENLTNAEYMEVLGYPALGRALRAGLRVQVGGGTRP